MKAFQRIKSLFQKKSNQPSTSRSPRASSPILSRSASALSFSSTQSLACVATEENSKDWSAFNKKKLKPVKIEYDDYPTENNDASDNVPLLGGIPRPETSECSAVEQKSSQLAQRYDKEIRHNVQKFQEAKENLGTDNLTGFWIRSHEQTQQLKKKYVNADENMAKRMTEGLVFASAQIVSDVASSVQRKTGSKAYANAAGTLTTGALSIYQGAFSPVTVLGLGIMSVCDVVSRITQDVDESCVIQELDKENKEKNGSYVRVTENEVPML